MSFEPEIWHMREFKVHTQRERMKKKSILECRAEEEMLNLKQRTNEWISFRSSSSSFSVFYFVVDEFYSLNEIRLMNLYANHQSTWHETFMNSTFFGRISVCQQNNKDRKKRICW